MCTEIRLHLRNRTLDNYVQILVYKYNLTIYIIAIEDSIKSIVLVFFCVYFPKEGRQNTLPLFINYFSQLQ